jgi:hypothetical protein
MPGSSLKIVPNDPRHKKICRMLESRINLAEKQQQKQHDVWRKAENAVLAYLPEKEFDRQRSNKRDMEGTPSYTTMYIPYSYALLMSAHTYWTSVFFARSPVHQFAGRHGEGENQTQAVEAMISYNVDVGRMLGPYYVQLYDAGKYGVGILGEFWDEQTIQRSWIEATDDGRVQQTSEVSGYKGNRTYNVSPWDFLPDPRVTVGNYQKGEFVAVRRQFIWNDLVRRARQGYITNLDAVKTYRGTTEFRNDGSGGSALERPDDNQTIYNMDGEDIVEHPAVVSGYEVYVDLIQKDWGLGNLEFPEKWCFTITRDKSLLLGAQPLGSMHGEFPFSVMECEIEGYGAWNRGLPETVEPIQNTMDWLLNVHFFNVRAALNNLFLVDPTKVVMKDLASPTPGGIIRLKPEAYGQDLDKMFKQIPVSDITRANISDIDLMLGIGERTTGVNDSIMGVLQNQGRKTATEVRTSTGFGVNRQKTITEYMSATAFAPQAQRFVMNCQQYYTTELKLRMVGSLAQSAGPQFLDVTPDTIAGFYDFVPVDGTLPVDRMAQVNMWVQILTALRQTPQVFMQYDPAKIFAWMATLGGVKNLNQFKVAPQIMPDAQLQSQVQQGNVVPMRNNDPSMTGVANPNQGSMFA